MKHFYTNIIAFSLASIVLFSTISVSLSMHYCCDELVDTSIFSNVETCGMKVQNTTSKKCSIEESVDCCDTKTFTKKGYDNFDRVPVDLNKETFVFLHTFVYTYVNLFEGLEQNIVPFLHHSPPLISKDIIVLHETFLI